MVTVALDLDPDKARPWIEAANPTHPSLVDSHHLIDARLGISNVPMAVWIDEAGTLVRPAEGASIHAAQPREITDDLPDRLKVAFTEINAMPNTGEAYRAAIGDWVAKGAESEFAWSPDEVVSRSQPRPHEHSRAAALFELGCHLHDIAGKDAAIPLWKEAHTLHRENWTYKRQAWTLESTPEGEDSDMAQEVGEVYGTSWLDDVLALGGGANYTVTPDL